MAGDAVRARLLPPLLALALGACAHASPPLAVIGYYPGDSAAFRAHRPERLTHIIYSFGHLRGSELFVDTLAARTTIPALVALKRQNPRLRVLLSLGGWTGCATCSVVFESDSGRKLFAASVRRLNDSLGTDGIDLDWEYPVIPGPPGHRYVPWDRESFTALVRALRAALGPGAEITFAAGGFSDYLTQAIDWAAVVPVVDRVHLMTYDLVHGYSKETGHHTPLRSTRRQPESVEHALHLLDSLGVPRAKVALGAAFYARVFGGVDSAGGGRYQAAWFARGVSWRDIDAGLAGFTRHWDRDAEAPYAYNPATREYATYDDTTSVRLKTRWARRHGLGGVMFWQLTDDAPSGGLLDAILAEAGR